MVGINVSRKILYCHFVFKFFAEIIINTENFSNVAFSNNDIDSSYILIIICDITKVPATFSSCQFNFRQFLIPNSLY